MCFVQEGKTPKRTLGILQYINRNWLMKWIYTHSQMDTIFLLKLSRKVIYRCSFDLKKTLCPNTPLKKQKLGWSTHVMFLITMIVKLKKKKKRHKQVISKASFLLMHGCLRNVSDHRKQPIQKSLPISPEKNSLYNHVSFVLDVKHSPKLLMNKSWFSGGLNRPP